jgi:hypothetical protein
MVRLVAFLPIAFGLNFEEITFEYLCYFFYTYFALCSIRKHFSGVLVIHRASGSYTDHAVMLPC